MFRKLVSLEDAKKRIEETFLPNFHETREIPLIKAIGRVLCEDVVSSVDVPPFHRSAMDGYAVRSKDTFGAQEDEPIELKLVGRANVGKLPRHSLKKQETVGIVTGAPLPQNADAVVMLENAKDKQGKVLVYKAVAKRENTMVKGSDFSRGQTVLKRGVILSSRELGVLAALGLSHIKVLKRPKVAIISTGAEIMKPGRPLRSGKIYDINTYTLTAAVMEAGGEPLNFEIVTDDDENLLETTLRVAIEKADVVITSGGVSVGPQDIVPKIVNGLGKPGLIVHGVAVKPGKPVAVAIVNNKLVFALPGNPTSSLLMFHLFVRPWLSKMAGMKEELPATVKAIVTEKLFSARGRRTFIMVTLSRGEHGNYLASPVQKGHSGAITTFADADGYIELKETEQFIEVGEERIVFLLKNLEKGK